MTTTLTDLQYGERLLVKKPVYFEKEDVTWMTGTEVIVGIVLDDLVFVSLPSKPNTAVGLNVSLLERA